jgi:hypothetical protein
LPLRPKARASSHFGSQIRYRCNASSYYWPYCCTAVEVIAQSKNSCRGALNKHQSTQVCPEKMYTPRTTYEGKHENIPRPGAPFCLQHRLCYFVFLFLFFVFFVFFSLSFSVPHLAVAALADSSFSMHHEYPSRSGPARPVQRRLGCFPSHC